MNFIKLLSIAIAVLLASQGCIFVRSTQHQIKLNSDGSGEGFLRLIDIRSDALTDSAIADDFTLMMAEYEKQMIEPFEGDGRVIKSKQLFVRGDTLIAEIMYSFSSIAAVEGFRYNEDEFFVVVDAAREIVRTNGSIKSGIHGGSRIEWDRSMKILQYQIREKTMVPSTSLASLYLRHTRR